MLIFSAIDPRGMAYQSKNGILVHCRVERQLSYTIDLIIARKLLLFVLVALRDSWLKSRRAVHDHQGGVED